MTLESRLLTTYTVANWPKKTELNFDAETHIRFPIPDSLLNVTPRVQVRKRPEDQVALYNLDVDANGFISRQTDSVNLVGLSRVWMVWDAQIGTSTTRYRVMEGWVTVNPRGTGLPITPTLADLNDFNTSLADFIDAAQDALDADIASAQALLDQAIAEAQTVIDNAAAQGGAGASQADIEAAIQTLVNNGTIDLSSTNAYPSVETADDLPVADADSPIAFYVLEDGFAWIKFEIDSEFEYVPTSPSIDFGAAVATAVAEQPNTFASDLRSYITNPEWGFDDTAGADNYDAFAACADATGCVIIPNIEVFLGQRYLSPANTKLSVYGLDKDKSILRCLGGQDAFNLLFTQGASRNLFAQNITLDGNKANTTAPASNALNGSVVFNQNSTVTLDNVCILNSISNGIRSLSSVSTSFTHTYLNSVVVRDSDINGIQISTRSFGRLFNTEVSGSGSHGINIAGSTDFEIISPKVFSNTGHGIVFGTESKNSRVIGGSSNNNTRSGVVFGNPPSASDVSHTNYRISDVVCTGNGEVGIVVDVARLEPDTGIFDQEGAVISGCVTNDNTINGFNINCADGLNLLNNSAHNNGVNGIATPNGANLRIEGNLSTGNGSTGFAILDTDAKTGQQNITMKNNRSSNNGVELALRNTESSTPTFIDSDFSLALATQASDVGKTITVFNNSLHDISLIPQATTNITGDTVLTSGQTLTATVTANSTGSTDYTTVIT